MTERWHRTRALVGLPGMPASARPIRLHGCGRGFISRDVTWGKRTRLEWLESSLPAETQAALRQSRGEEAPPPTPLPAAGPAEDATWPANCGASSAIPLDDGRAAVADARVEIVTAFRRWREGRSLPLMQAFEEWTALYNETGAGVSADTRDLIPSFHWNTLRRWGWRYGERDFMALLPGAGGRRCAIEQDPEVREKIEALIFERPHHVTCRQILRVLAASFPDRTFSISQVRRFVRKWRARNGYDLSAVSDPDGHRSATMPAFGSESEAVTALNEVWEFDSTKIDVICADGKRYALVAAIDVFSRRAKALVVPTSKSTAIAALLRRCLIGWGVPAAIKTDQGADYTSRHLKRVLNDLGVQHILCPPYRADKKPFIERFIRTISHGLFSQVAGFAGHNVADREKIRSRKSFAARRGEDKTKTFSCDLTAEQLQERIDSWCENVYGREPHGGLEGQSPYLKAASFTGERRRVEERGLDALLAPAAGNGRRKVKKKGINVDGGRYIAAELGDHMDEWVHVRQDPADYGRIYVYLEERDALRFVCIAEDEQRIGKDRKQEIAAKARGRAAARDKRARARARELSPLAEAAMDEVLAQSKADAERVVVLPARTQEHRTAALDAAAEAEDAAQEADAPPERKRVVNDLDRIVDMDKWSARYD